MSTFSIQAQAQLEEKGISKDQLQHYQDVLKEGYPYIQLAQNCRLTREIHRTNEEERKRYRLRYQTRSNLKVVKFVPASGAASRMFKDLYSSLEKGEINSATEEFFSKIEQFAFYKALMETIGAAKEIPLQDSMTRMDILRALLLEEGMNYGNLPKGLIQFHRYPDGTTRTAFEEHFHEAKMYGMSAGKAHLHFTIPESASREVNAHLKGLTEWLGASLEATFEVETSLQKPSTDTPAIYADSHEWVTHEDGSLLFRPAGHGALLANLNDLEGDLVFIKNIDNVVPDHLKNTTVEYKEVLAGILLEVQESIFGFMKALESDTLDRQACADFFNKWFQQDISGLDNELLRALLDRPLRVCGMVENEDEPGGGPFVVDDGGGRTSLQIVEKAQVDPNDPSQMELFNKASHFNPVDLVVSLKNHKGEAYDLMKFRKSDTGMVVSKTHHGRAIKALELPGLWNGSMHYWNTVFVEVPGQTFNPVKTVFDLLRPMHRGV